MDTIRRRYTGILIKKMTTTAIFIAISIIATRFLSLYLFSKTSRIGLGTLPIILCSLINGPFFGALCGVAADFIGTVLFEPGPYLFVYSISAALQGIFPYLLNRFVLKQKYGKIATAGFITLVLELTLGLYLIFNDTFKFSGVVYELSLSTKLATFFIFNAIILLMFTSIYFISKKLVKYYQLYGNNDIFNTFAIITFNEIVIIVILGALWKQVCFDIAFPAGIVTSFIFFVPNVIVKGIVTLLLSNAISSIDGKYIVGNKKNNSVRSYLSRQASLHHN